MKKFMCAGLTALGLLAGAMASQADASTVTLKYEGSGPFGTPDWSQRVDYKINGTQSASMAGLFRLQNTANDRSVLAWCIDLFNTISLPTAHSFNPGLVTSAERTNLDKLFTSAYAGVSGAVKSAAFQVAIWEIVSDSDGSLDLTKGNFQVTSTNLNVLATAKGYLTGLASAGTGGYQLTFLDADKSQDLVTVSQVPLPAAGLMLGLGVAGLGALRRRKRTA